MALASASGLAVDFMPSTHASGIVALDATGGEAAAALPLNAEGNVCKTLRVVIVSGSAIRVKFGASDVEATSADMRLASTVEMFTPPPGTTHISATTGELQLVAGYE